MGAPPIVVGRAIMMGTRSKLTEVGLRALVLILSLIVVSFLLTVPYSAAGSQSSSSSPPTLDVSNSFVSISTPVMVFQLDSTKPNVMVFYHQDASQEFRLRISLLQLMEVTPSNLTQSRQILDTLDLQSLVWEYSLVTNSSDADFGHFLVVQLSTAGTLQRASGSYPVNVTLEIFASQGQNETRIITSDWAALEPVGGPTLIKTYVSIRGWSFRTQTDLLDLRLLIDGSAGTVLHHEEFTATELYNTISVVSDVTGHTDANVQWLRRAVIDNGTIRKSADVTLNTFDEAGALGVDLYYASFTNATLEHDPVVGVMASYLQAPYVPIDINIVIFGATSLLALTIVTGYLSRRSYDTLRRNK